MDEFYNKHYIRVDTDNRIIKGFSDAFEEPIDGDICIKEQGGRHFEMFGIVNPPLMDMQSVYIYKYADGVIVERTADEMQGDINNLPPESPTLSEQIATLSVSINNNTVGMAVLGASTVSRLEDVEADVDILKGGE